MAAYQIKLTNGWIATVNCASSEQDAIEQLKIERVGMGYESTEVAEIRRMKEAYGNGGYGLVALEEFHPV
jgi:hypothetical protein